MGKQKNFHNIDTGLDSPEKEDVLSRLSAPLEDNAFPSLPPIPSKTRTQIKPSLPAVSNEAKPKTEKIRVNFYIKKSSDEIINDLVYREIMRGNRKFTKNKVVQKALDLYFSTLGDIPPRPHDIEEEDPE